jgi:hypothetical protein
VLFFLPQDAAPPDQTYKVFSLQTPVSAKSNFLISAYPKSFAPVGWPADLKQSPNQFHIISRFGQVFALGLAGRPADLERTGIFQSAAAEGEDVRREDGNESFRARLCGWQVGKSAGFFGYFFIKEKVTKLCNPQPSFGQIQLPNLRLPKIHCTCGLARKSPDLSAFGGGIGACAAGRWDFLDLLVTFGSSQK